MAALGDSLWYLWHLWYILVYFWYISGPMEASGSLHWPWREIAVASPASSSLCYVVGSKKRINLLRPSASRPRGFDIRPSSNLLHTHLSLSLLYRNPLHLSRLSSSSALERISLRILLCLRSRSFALRGVPATHLLSPSLSLLRPSRPNAKRPGSYYLH